MIPVKIKDDVYSLRANDWDRKLFDELVPLPDGTSYNAYLIKGGDKTALIDTVYPPKTAAFIAALKASGVETIDYVVANHAELDHAGSIPAVLELFPKAKVVANARCWRMLCDQMPLDRRSFLEAKDGGALPLGGKTLKFVFMPWVHWPETMGVFLEAGPHLLPLRFPRRASRFVRARRRRRSPVRSGGQALLRRDHGALPRPMPQRAGAGGSARAGDRRAQPRPGSLPGRASLSTSIASGRRTRSSPRS